MKTVNQIINGLIENNIPSINMLAFRKLEQLSRAVVELIESSDSDDLRELAGLTGLSDERCQEILDLKNE